MIGKSIVELQFPEDSRIVVIWRDNQIIVPKGNTILEAADTLLILVNKNNLDSIRKIFSSLIYSILVAIFPPLNHFIISSSVSLIIALIFIFLRRPMGKSALQCELPFLYFTFTLFEK
jgi:NhaP-type Na+/H+ and K+/H+ antiporter